MRTRSIGSLDVTVVGIGCNNFGRELDLAATREIVHAALDEGITFFDTADTYGRPKTASETFLGNALKGNRDKVVIATKFGRMLDERRQGAKPAYVRSATEASLQRLQTDRIDLMQLHIPDLTTPIEDTLGALKDLIAEGKIGEIGNSNVSPKQLRAMDAVARSHGLPRFVSTQAEFNLLYRAEPAELLAECERIGVGFVPFRPLFHGLLAGKYRTGAVLAPGTRIGDKSADQQAQILSPGNLRAVELLASYAQDKGRSLLDLAFAWLLSHPDIPSVIAGVSSPRQVASNAKAADWVLSLDERSEVAGLLALAAGDEMRIGA